MSNWYIGRRFGGAYTTLTNTVCLWTKRRLQHRRGKAYNQRPLCQSVHPTHCMFLDADRRRLSTGFGGANQRRWQSLSQRNLSLHSVLSRSPEIGSTVDSLGELLTIARATPKLGGEGKGSCLPSVRSLSIVCDRGGRAVRRAGVGRGSVIGSIFYLVC